MQFDVIWCTLQNVSYFQNATAPSFHPFNQWSGSHGNQGEIQAVTLFGNLQN